MTELDERQVVESQRILELLFAYMPKIAAERKMDGLLILMADLGRSIVVAEIACFVCNRICFANDGC